MTISKPTAMSDPRPEATFSASRIVRAGFSRTLSPLDHLALGGATPRGCPREGFPEIELHRLLAGRPPGKGW